MGPKAARYEQLRAERSLTGGGEGRGGEGRPITDRAAADLAFLKYSRKSMTVEEEEEDGNMQRHGFGEV